MLHNLSQGFLNPIKRLAMRLLTTKMPWRVRDWRQTWGINFETKHESALSHYGTGFALDVGDINKFWELRSTLQNIPIVIETRPCFFFSSLTSAFCVFTLVHKDGHVTPNTTLIIMDVERFPKKYTWLGKKKGTVGGTNVTQCMLEDCWYENINLLLIYFPNMKNRWVKTCTKK